MIFFFLFWYLVAIAQGAHTPCVQAFGADQFDDEDKKECKAKSSFNWWYCISSGGILVPLLCLTYIQDHVGWELRFGITAVVMVLTLIVFLFGTPSYRFRLNADGGNPFVRINRVFVKAFKNWRAAPIVVSNDEEARAILPLENTQFKFLNKALLASDISLEDEKFCSIEDVEDTKSILRLIPIWCTAMGYSIVYAHGHGILHCLRATFNSFHQASWNNGPYHLRFRNTRRFTSKLLHYRFPNRIHSAL